MSRIRADRVTNKEGTGAPLFPNGIRVVGLTSLSNVIAGVTTFTSDVSIGGTLTYEDVTNIDSVGLITARSGLKVTSGGIDVAGGGSNIVGVVTASTGIDAASNLILKTGGNEKVRISSTGLVGINETTPEEILDLGEDNKQNLKVGQRGYLGQAHSTSATILGHSVKADTTNSVADQMMVTETNSGGGAPSAIRQTTGTIQFHTASSGTADAVFSSERLRIGAAGQIGIAGANYGTSGQVLTSGGGSAAPSWADAGGVWSLIDNNKVTTNVSAIDVSFGANAGITTSYAQIKVYYNIWLASGDKLYVRGGYGFNGNIAADIKTSDYWWSGYWHRAGDSGMNNVTTGENAGYALISANNNKTQHSGEMIFDNSAGRMRVSGSASWPAMVYNTQGFSGGDNDAHNFTISGQLKGGDNSPMSGFRIYSGGPSIVSGEVRTYGLSAT